MDQQEGRRPRRFEVGSADEVPLGGRKLFNVPHLGEVGVFNIRGEYFAVRNVCPHMGGPMCAGKLTGTTEPRFEAGRRPEPEWVRDGEILRCPWHGWEFDIRTGKALFSDRTRVTIYDVRIGNGEDASAAETPRDAETYPVHVEVRRLIIEVPERRSRDSVEAGEGVGAG